MCEYALIQSLLCSNGWFTHCDALIGMHFIYLFLFRIFRLDTTETFWISDYQKCHHYWKPSFETICQKKYDDLTKSFLFNTNDSNDRIKLVLKGLLLIKIIIKLMCIQYF